MSCIFFDLTAYYRNITSVRSSDKFEIHNKEYIITTLYISLHDVLELMTPNALYEQITII